MNNTNTESNNLSSVQSITTQPQSQVHQHQPQPSFNKQINYPHQPSSSNAVKTGTQPAVQPNQKSQKPQQNPGHRKVYIQRDYSEGTSVRFQNKFPPELEGYIERQHFDYLITTLNCYYDKAEATNPSTFCEGFCACFSAYLIYICMETHYEKYMKKTKEYIDEQNDKVWKPRGLYVTDPIDRGLRIIEITITSKAVQKDMVGDQHKREQT